jgi:hypothetical protein
MSTAKIHTELLAPSYSLQDLAKLRDLFRTLANGIKAVRQYPPGHPVANGFVQILHEKLGQFFAQNQLLSVRVTREGVLAGDDVIVAMESDADNLAAILHRDGVRSLEIKPAVAVEELDTLLTALADGCGPEEERRDLGYLFCHAQFDNINCEIVDLFETEEIELSLTGDQSEETVELPTELQLDPNEVELEANPLEKQFRELFGSLDEFSTEELATFNKMLSEQRRVDLRSEGIMLLLAIYSDSDSLNEQVAAIEKLKVVLDQCTREARFVTLTHFLERAGILLEECSSDIAKRQRLAGFLLRCGDSVRLKMVTAVLNQNAEIDMEPVRSYLRLLGNDATANLVNMLGKLEHYSSRKMICDLLVEKDLNRIDIIGNAVFDRRWYLVRNIAWVLGEARAAQGITFLTKAATHQDERVRLEVVKALGKINTEAAVRLLIAMFGDESERIASTVANELGHTGSPIAFDALAELVDSKNYSYLPLGRMRLLAEALVTCDADRALEMVERTIKRRNLLGRARLRQAQEVLVNALQVADSSGVVAWLESLSEKSNSFLAPVARKSLRQISARQKKTNDDKH